MHATSGAAAQVVPHCCWARLVEGPPACSLAPLSRLAKTNADVTPTCYSLQPRRANGETVGAKVGGQGTALPKAAARCPLGFPLHPRRLCFPALSPLMPCLPYASDSSQRSQVGEMRKRCGKAALPHPPTIHRTPPHPPILQLRRAGDKVSGAAEQLGEAESSKRGWFGFGRVSAQVA